MHPLKIIMKSKGDNVTTVANSCQAPSKCSIMVVSIVVIVILTRCRRVGIVFSASFFSIGELGHLSHEGHCSLWYSVLDLRVLGLLVPVALVSDPILPLILHSLETECCETSLSFSSCHLLAFYYCITSYFQT